MRSFEKSIMAQWRAGEGAGRTGHQFYSKNGEFDQFQFQGR